MAAIANTTTPDLASRLRLAITRTARRLRQEADGGLSPSMTSALATVERRGPLTPSRLAELERIQRPTATRVATRLEEAGLVERAVDPLDGRSRVLRVTPEGRALLRRVRSRKTAFLARRLATLPHEDLLTLERSAEILERLLDDGRRA
ncbi:MAG TPA: MarR family transcriptional regulator [Thermoleophilaceae bacterium]|jgi:DNA-binding MarR family transcriptional regulator